MIKRMSLGRFRKEASPADIAAFKETRRALPEHVPTVSRVTVGSNLNSGNNTRNDKTDWDVIWGIEYLDRPGVETYVQHPYHVKTLQPNAKAVLEKSEVTYYDPTFNGGHEVAVHEVMFHRVMLFRVRKGTSAEKIHELEGCLQRLGREVSGVKNWTLGRAVAPTPADSWTHIWEQEIADEAGWKEYFSNTYHKEVVATLFLPDRPECITDKLAIVWHKAYTSFVSPRGEHLK